MRVEPSRLRLSASDLSDYLSCYHLTSLNLEVACGKRTPPELRSADLFVIQELGLRHEAEYLNSLHRAGLPVIDLREIKDEQEAVARTQTCMEAGAQVIAQGTLEHGRWIGRPDVLRRVTSPSRFGNWSYEVYDCKLAPVTKAATILQLCLYSSLLAEIQEREPEIMHVVPARRNFRSESYRFAEYAAYYRHVRRRLEEFCDSGTNCTSYPEPCAHCEICNWFSECDSKRRDDDHLSLVSGITRFQRNQFTRWETETMTKLAHFPIPLPQAPEHGSKETYERVREQARVQVEGRNKKQPVFELLPTSPGIGLSRLPEPSGFDIFLDLESDPFVGESGRHYLFGFVARDPNGDFKYEKRWSFSASQENEAFQWVIDRIMDAWRQAPVMHVYHYGAHEAAALKALMGTYAAREDEVDRMLRAGLLVDLHPILKQSVRASVEEYSLKAMEAFHAFNRTTPLQDSREAMRYLEHSLELETTEPLPDKVRSTIEGYNQDDCLSAASLREWLEDRRRQLEKSGTAIARPPILEGTPSEELDEQQRRVAILFQDLMTGIPIDSAERTAQQSARALLANLLDWHRRENKAGWWEGFRLAELDDEELLDERVGLAGMQFVQRVSEERKIPTDRYTYVEQETEVRPEKELFSRGEKVGTVAAVDSIHRTVDVKKTRKTAEVHPGSVYMWDRPYNTAEHADALLRIGEWVKNNGIQAPGPYKAARDLLLRNPPRLHGGQPFQLPSDRSPVHSAIRVVSTLNESLLAIQGPPGAGKTFTGARVICDLVRRGRKVGVTALSHKVISKLLDEVVDAARQEEIENVRCMQKSDEAEETEDIRVVRDNDQPLRALRSGAANVVGGTSWLWARPEYFESVDTLFIDEAGQMALADVISVSQAAKNVVLIGDPQQLERPLKGSHPLGAEKSALQHLLGNLKTIPDNMGLLLPESWRLHPRICSFTSELFYDGRLAAHESNRHRIVEGHPWLTGAGLWYVPVDHDANRNSSPEEVKTVVRILDSLLRPEVSWVRSVGNSAPLRLSDILVVTPYNSQVAELLAALPQGAIVGTVDKFQGQEAPVVIYSLATSSPEEAPRGMEFLYSLNRLNVATSRGQSAVVLVGSFRLFEPECRTPRQIQLANAFCRYRELATLVPCPT